MSMEIIPTARLRPGSCVLSGDTQGPFIDTGKNIRMYGQVYISIKSLRHVIKKLDYLAPEDARDILQENSELAVRVDELEAVKEEYDSLIATVSAHLPVPEPRVVEKTVTVTRAPNDEEISQWIVENGADNEVVRRAGKIEKGSTEEWNKLYRDSQGRPLPSTKSTTEAKASVVEQEEDPAEVEEGPSKKVTLLDQTVDLSKLLSENVNTIVSYCEGKPEDFVARVVEYEFHVAEVKERDPRKGLLEPLGYWDEEEGPLFPDFEADEEEEENNG